MLSEYALVKRPAQFEAGLYPRDGVVLRDMTNGQIVGHMEEVFSGRLPSLPSLSLLSSPLHLGVSMLNFAYMRGQFTALNKRIDQIETKIDRLDAKIDALIGKVDFIGGTLTELANKIDSRHKEMVFAELGAVLDTLSYADRKDPASAQTLVASNLTPARKAIRLFDSFVEECESALPEGDIGRVETSRMRLLSALLSVEIDLVLGEGEAAMDAAHACALDVQLRNERLLATLLAKYPLASWVDENSAENLLVFCDQIEIIDGISARRRLARDAIEKDRGDRLALAKKEAPEFNASSDFGIIVQAGLMVYNAKRTIKDCRALKPETTSKPEIIPRKPSQDERDAIGGMVFLSAAARGAAVETAVLLSEREAAGSLRKCITAPFQDEFALIEVRRNG